MGMILNNNNVFDIDGGSFKLLTDMNANGRKIVSLGAGSADADGVNYLQIKDMVQSLSGVTPGTPGVSDLGSAVRVVTSTVTSPWGGFYMFYWCVDSSAGASLSLSGGTVVASSGATVNFDGSVANIVNIIKDAGWQGKYFHVACRYRNIKNISGLSATGTALIALPGYIDIIDENVPPEARDVSISSVENTICIVGGVPEREPPGVTYRAEILLDDGELTEIKGTEPGLISMINSTPVFRYDLPISKGKYSYVHVRVASVTLMRKEQITATLHSKVSLDTDVLNDSYLNYIALKMSERMQTQDGTPLKPKE